ncbi:hypothetical protein [Streptomyces sp. NBC_00568]|uniref:hypothetical protein n=1 Tax=Streptomyces sp. NBC_00568 TaxID=2975779 RepID=UPI00225C237F|nr:hypothetical protein [Streptomyces sp. NBC_00568]MCX4993439.1 hypothetical protein [Streptomyces sp. NBC_00568]
MHSDNVLEVAVGIVVDGYRADRSGQGQPAGLEKAVSAAHAAGYSSADIFSAADRRFGQELIDNAGQYQ